MTKPTSNRLPQLWVIFLLLAFSVQSFGVVGHIQGPMMEAVESEMAPMSHCDGMKDVGSAPHNTASNDDCCGDNCSMTNCHTGNVVANSFRTLSFLASIPPNSAMNIGHTSFLLSTLYRPPISSANTGSVRL